MIDRIDMNQGFAIAPEIIEHALAKATGHQSPPGLLGGRASTITTNACLPSLKAYMPLVSLCSYCVVINTIIENISADMFPRPTAPGYPSDKPKTAVWEYLKTHPEFEIDKQMDHKLLISIAPDTYLKRAG